MNFVDFCRGNPLWLPFSQDDKQTGAYPYISIKILEEPERKIRLKC